MCVLMCIRMCNSEPLIFEDSSLPSFLLFFWTYIYIYISQHTVRCNIRLRTSAHTCKCCMRLLNFMETTLTRLDTKMNILKAQHHFLCNFGWRQMATQNTNDRMWWICLCIQFIKSPFFWMDAIKLLYGRLPKVHSVFYLFNIHGNSIMIAKRVPSQVETCGMWMDCEWNRRENYYFHLRNFIWDVPRLPRSQSLNK